MAYLAGVVEAAMVGDVHYAAIVSKCEDARLPAVPVEELFQGAMGIDLR